MKKIFLAILMISVSQFAFTQAFQWAVQAGGPGTNSTSDKAEAVTVDSQGNIIVTGIFEGTAQFGTTSLTSAGSNDIFLTKYSPTGQIIWAVRAGGTSLDWPKGICTDKNDNIIITGQFSGTATFGTSTNITASSTDIFVAKYNSNGVLQWAKKEGGSSVNRGLAIAADTAGNVIVTGDFSGTATFGTTSLNSAGAADIFLMKYNPSGNVLWAKKAGNTVNDRATAVATDISGNIYITGSFGATVTFGTTQLSATGGTNDTDIFTAKYDSQGNVVWAKKGGSNSSVVEEARGIAIDDNNNIYVTGLLGGNASFDGTNTVSQGASDVFLAKYNNNGIIQWLKSGGGVNDDEGTAVSVSPNGNILVSGFFIGSATFSAHTINAFGGTSDFDGFICSYNPNGNLNWLKSIGRTGEDRATGIASAFDNQIYVTGFFRNNILFDNIQLTSQGYSDIFLAQINDFITIDTLNSHVYCAGDIIQVDFNTNILFNISNEFILWVSDQTGSFANAVEIGNLNATSSGTIYGALPYNLPTGSNYRIRIEATDEQSLSPIYHSAITINASPPKPVPLTPIKYCEGDSLIYIKVDAQNVFWYADGSLNTVIQTGDSLFVNILLTTDTVFYCVQENTSNCYSQLTEIEITLNNNPVITNNLSDSITLCTNNEEVTMDLTPSGGDFSGAGVMSGTNIFNPLMAQNGFHIINYSYTDTNNCTSVYELYFDVLSAPVVSIDTSSVITINDGDTIMLNGSPQGGTFSGEGIVNNLFIADQNTLTCNPCIITYIYEALNGCYDTASIEINVTTGINIDIQNEHILIFPVPTKDCIYIYSPEILSEMINIQLIDIQGMIIMNKDFYHFNQTSINIASFSKGIYFIKVTSEKNNLTRKIIKI